MRRASRSLLPLPGSSQATTPPHHLRLHLPMNFYELPGMPFVGYLEAYAACFGTAGLWQVHAEEVGGGENIGVIMEYIGRWLVMATGENAERIPPELDGMEEFRGPVSHMSEYKSGAPYCGKCGLVVDCGNSGMEVCLDLYDHNALPAMVVKDSVFFLRAQVQSRRAKPSSSPSRASSAAGSSSYEPTGSPSPRTGQSLFKRRHSFLFAELQDLHRAKMLEGTPAEA